jgi:hypothetical protein
VQGVFTRIRSGAIVVVSDGGALGYTFPLTVAVRTGGGSWHDLLGMTANVWGEKT